MHYANGVFTPSGEYYIIDLTRFHWYPASKELVRIYRRLLGGIESRISTFEQKYFSDAGEKQHREFTRQRPFFEAMYMLDQVVKKSSRATRAPAREEELGESRDYAWEQLLQIVRA